MIVSDLTVNQGRKTILKNIGFCAQPGAVTAIVGPNGSGKSTLLRAMTGELPATGSRRLNDIDVSSADPSELAGMRAVLAQSTPVAFAFSVTDIVRLGHAAGRAAPDPSVPDRALASVGLAGFGARPYHSLSGGEQQRVHLARALAQVWQNDATDAPRWLFLDEPISSLDIGHQLMVVDLLLRFARAGGGVIVVMHDLNLTAMLADTVYLLKNGAVLDKGRPDRVITSQNLTAAYDHPLTVSPLARSGSPSVLPQHQILQQA